LEGFLLWLWCFGVTLATTLAVASTIWKAGTNGWMDGSTVFFGGGIWLGDSFGSFKVKQKLLNSIILKGTFLFFFKPPIFGYFWI